MVLLGLDCKRTTMGKTTAEKHEKKWGDHHSDVPSAEIATQPLIKRQMIAFRHQMTDDFPIKFNIPGWEIIDFADRHKYKSQYYFQINVDKPSNRTKEGEVIDPVYDYIKETGKPYLVCELSCFRQNSYQGDPNNWYYTLGWFHFLRQGLFRNNNSPGDRWNQIQKHQNIEILPWRTQVRDNDYALVCLQKVNDSTLIPMHETHGKYKWWIEVACKQIRNIYPKLPIIIRPHLRTKLTNYMYSLHNIQNVHLSKTWEDRTYHEGGAGLQSDLDGARFVVGYNSNVLTQSVLQGIPTVCWDIRSAASPVCLDPSQLKNIEQAHNIDREQWLYDLGYTQWTRAEISNGHAWNHLKQYEF